LEDELPQFSRVQLPDNRPVRINADAVDYIEPAHEAGYVIVHLRSGKSVRVAGSVDTALAELDRSGAQPPPQ
jgi:hypothetical protein